MILLPHRLLIIITITFRSLRLESSRYLAFSISLTILILKPFPPLQRENSFNTSQPVSVAAFSPVLTFREIFMPPKTPRSQISRVFLVKNEKAGEKMFIL